MSQDEIAQAVAELEHTYDYWTKRIDSEDQLIDHRMQWLLVSQGLIFTAIGFGGATSAATIRPVGHTISAVVRVIPWVGFITATFQWISIMAAIITSHWAKQKLATYYQEWQHRVDNASKQTPPLWIIRHRSRALRPERPNFPQFQRARLGFYAGFAAPLIVPPVFIAAWIYVVIVSF